MVRVFSTLIGASVAVGASVGAAVAGGSAGASVASGAVGAAVGAAPPHAASTISARETRIARILRFDGYILSSSGKVVWELAKRVNLWNGQTDGAWKRFEIAAFRFRRINID